MKFGEMSESYSQNCSPAWTTSVNVATDLVLLLNTGNSRLCSERPGEMLKYICCNFSQ